MNILTSIVRFATMAAAIVLLLTAYPIVVRAGDSRIVTFTSQEAAPYREVLAGFRRHLARNGINAVFEEHSLQGDATKATQALHDIKKTGARLLFTVGSLATQAALKEANGTPIIACLVVNADDLRKAPNATGVVVDFPVEIQLQWLHRLLPDNKIVGVLFNPKENRDRIEDATRVARELGLKLIARPVETPQALPDALESLAKEADVLWGVTDQTVLSPQTAEPILLFSFRNRIPFAGLSTSWVKAGALYALDRDYSDLGAQCGEMAFKVLAGTPASALPPAAPRKVTYAVNLKTAQHMKVDIPQGLIAGAQQIFQ